MSRPDLDWLLWQLDMLLTEMPRIDASNLDEEDIEVFITCFALFRKAYMYGRSLNVLLHDSEAETVSPLARSLYEIYLDIKYTLGSQDPAHNIKKMQISSRLQIIRAALPRRHQFDRRQLRRLIADLKRHKKQFPRAYAEVRKQRQFHWSGMSRSKVEKELQDDPVAYKYLSLEAHSVLTPATEILPDFQDGGLRLEFAPLLSNEQSSDWYAYIVGAMLSGLWNDLADRFGLPRIELPQ